MSSIPSAAADLTARLVCRIRPGHTEKFTVAKSEVVVGREPGLAVTIPVDGVSRRHARITFDGKSYLIENLSPAGTFLNGALVVQERLAHLDVITLGRNVELLFLLRAGGGEGTSTMEGIVRAALVTGAVDAVPYEIAPGEILLGRSTANNVVTEASGAVSKIHARIERSPQQLVLRDLGSSNGTYVNGERVMTALLKDGDVIALANVVEYRVVIERGRVVAPAAGSSSAAAVLAPDDETRLQFSPEWKTRYDWDSSEIKDIAALQARLLAEDLERKAAKAKKDAAPAKAAAKAAAKPAAPAKPGATPTKPAAAATPTKPAAAATPEAANPAAAAPSPAAALSPQANDASVAKAAADALAAHGVPLPHPVEPPVTEIRLTGPAGDLVVTEPGEYTLGRSKEAQLRVDNPTVSRRHALIFLSTERVAFVDHGGGANGTRRNGETVTGRVRLHDGDKIAIGEVELLVRLKTLDPR